MSSAAVRTAFKTAIETAISPDVLIDFSGDFRDIRKLLDDNSIGSEDGWVGVEFIPGEEIPITTGGSAFSNQGITYRETGVVTVHVVGPAVVGGFDNLVSRAETIIDALRGKRLGVDGKISVVSVVMPVSNDGAAINFGNAWTTALFLLEYQRDRNY